MRRGPLLPRDRGARSRWAPWDQTLLETAAQKAAVMPPFDAVVLAHLLVVQELGAGKWGEAYARQAALLA
jgi:hypothetical protein